MLCAFRGCWLLFVLSHGCGRTMFSLELVVAVLLVIGCCVVYGGSGCLIVCLPFKWFSGWLRCCCLLLLRIIADTRLRVLDLKGFAVVCFAWCVRCLLFDVVA